MEVLSQLEMWEELANCYQAVGRMAKAKELVQEQLDREPTPSLLCLMGDLTQVRSKGMGGEVTERWRIYLCLFWYVP